MVKLVVLFTILCNLVCCQSKAEIDFKRTKFKAEEALQYCKKNKFNQNFCILVDMSIHSGLNRLILWDFKKDSILYTCLVGHGSWINQWSRDFSKTNPKFSNEEDSHCSSLGKYKLGSRGYSDWGIHIKYFLSGLEATNSNAMKRTIVFHSWELMSDVETYPDGSPEGWGCPTVSNKSMQYLDKLLMKTKNSTLFWIYN